MPELPEVETVRRGLEKICGRSVKKIFRSAKKLRLESAIDLQKLEGCEVLSVERRARYLIINFNKNLHLIVHLGMSGRVTLCDEFKRLKHDHFACEFDDEQWLVFNDPRRFGFVDLVDGRALKNHKMLKKLGVEPLLPEFDFTVLKASWKDKKMNVKTSLMDNQVVVGVGNIYASESLFDAKILPTKDACKLSDNELKKLTNSVKKILQHAIDLGGSSINDYVDAKGVSGQFQNDFKVYGKAGEKCLLCKDLVHKTTQNGRSTFYCPTCQK